MNKKQKKMLIRIVLSAVMLVALYFIPLDGWIRFVFYLVPYLIIGYDILIKAGKGIKNRQIFDESFLMAIATIGSHCLGYLRTKRGLYRGYCRDAVLSNR